MSTAGRERLREPRTATGQRLARNLRTLNLTPPEPDDWPENDIRAIEEEAAALAHDRPSGSGLREAALMTAIEDGLAVNGAHVVSEQSGYHMPVTGLVKDIAAAYRRALSGSDDPEAER